MSGFFEFETRACPDCGGEFRALKFWGADVPCDVCNRARYDARLAAINEGRAYTLTEIGGACPTQAEGRTWDDRPLYFRARHGHWTLRVGDVGGDVENVYIDGELVAEGNDPSGGFMEPDAVVAILDAHLAQPPSP